ncbi:hypothetical protein [Pseudoxanthomonas mexicana]|uniref:hypothetical protein n=1 Tax=Pseudoxanthomonas mexicana TaxID=128785 RepID=UPI00398B01A4
MIKHADYFRILQTLLRCHGGPAMTQAEGLPHPRNVHLIERVQEGIDGGRFIATEQVAEGIRITFENNRNRFLIRKTDSGKIDPPLYFEEDGQWALDFKTSSIILLTDFAMHLHRNAAHRTQRDDLGGQAALKEHFRLICKEKDFFSEIWLHAETDCFALLDRVEERIFFVADKAETIARIDSLFPRPAAARPRKPGKTKAAPVSGFLADAYLVDGDLHGKAKLPGHAHPVEVVFESENGETDFSQALDFGEAVIGKLTPRKQAQLLERIANEIAHAVFSQSDRDEDERDLAGRLKEDLRIACLVFVEQDILMILAADGLFPRREVVAQLDGRLSPVDITLAEAPAAR